MYVKSLRELSIFAFAFHYRELHEGADFSQFPLYTRELILQWLFDHDTGLLLESQPPGSSRPRYQHTWREDVDTVDEQHRKAAIDTYFLNTNLFLGISRLEVVSSEILCDELLTALSKQCANIKSISFDHCKNFSDEGMSALALSGKLDRLESVEIVSCDGYSGRSLDKIQSQSLSSVILRFLRIEWASFVRMLDGNQQIEVLDLQSSSFNGGVDELREIPFILEDNLVSLVLPKTSRRLEPFIQALCIHSPQIKRLDLTSASLERGLIELVEHCPEIVDLQLTFCHRLLSGSQSEIYNLPPRLTTLSLAGLPVTTDTMGRIVHCCPDLVDLNICGVPAAMQDPDFLKLIAERLGGQLKRLNMNHMPVLSDELLAPVGRHCQTLEDLRLAGSPHLTGSSLLNFFTRRASRLKRLTLYCAKFERHVLEAAVTHCAALARVDLVHLGAVDDDLCQLLASQRSSTLKKVGLTACRNVTDAGVVALATNCNLTSINLSGMNGITNKSVLCIARCCPTARNVYLSGCSRITADAITYLKDQCIGRVFVSHRNPSANNCNLINVFNHDIGHFVTVNSETGIY